MAEASGLLPSLLMPIWGVMGPAWVWLGVGLVYLLPYPALMFRSLLQGQGRRWLRGVVIAPLSLSLLAVVLLRSYLPLDFAGSFWLMAVNLFVVWLLLLMLALLGCHDARLAVLQFLQGAWGKWRQRS